MDSIKIDEDVVPNFKANADKETGVVPGQQLTGKYERVGTAPIVLWKRNNGDLVVITGRHRFDLAKRTGEQTIPAQIVEESKGFTKDMAITFDAEANIRDGQGNTDDYAHYFKNSPDLTEAEAGQRGLLSRAKGKAGWDMAKSASDDLYAAWKNGRIKEADALAVTRAAPGNVEAQRLGLKLLLDGKGGDLAANVVKVALSESGGKTETMDLFGGNDELMNRMEEQARRALSIQRDLRQDLQAISGASKNPEAASKYGVNVNDPAALKAKADELRAELKRWDNWPLHPDLVSKTKGEPPPGNVGPGMGGAIPSEFEPTFKSATSIKNATVDSERAARGARPSNPPAGPLEKSGTGQWRWLTTTRPSKTV